MQNMVLFSTGFLKLYVQFIPFEAGEKWLPEVLSISTVATLKAGM